LKRTLAALAGALLALGACGGSDPAGEGAGTKVHTVAEYGFSVAVPSDWKTVKPGDLLSDEDAESFRRENPEIGAYLEAISGPNSPIKFFAFDPDVKEKFATNLNVVVLPLSAGVSFDQWARAAVAEVKKLPSRSGPIHEDRVALPAGDALRLSYRQEFSFEGGERTVSTVQYALLGEARSYVLTFTTLPEAEASYDGIFRAAVRSFEITE
jgi:hypothetical protein